MSQPCTQHSTTAGHRSCSGCEWPCVDDRRLWGALMAAKSGTMQVLMEKTGFLTGATSVCSLPSLVHMSSRSSRSSSNNPRSTIDEQFSLVCRDMCGCCIGAMGGILRPFYVMHRCCCRTLVQKQPRWLQRMTMHHMMAAWQAPRCCTTMR